MKLNEVIIIVKRLYREYIKKYLSKIFIAIFLSVLVAGSTSAIAWLLDPAVKKIFIEQDKTFAVFIPVLVILAFMGKGISLYYARSIVIVLGNRIKQTLQNKKTHTRRSVASLALLTRMLVSPKRWEHTFELRLRRFFGVGGVLHTSCSCSLRST